MELSDNSSSYLSGQAESRFFKLIYQNRLSSMETVQSTLNGLDHRFGDDFYERVMRKGILNHVFMNHE